MRVSTAGPERGSADCVRDVRGFALKIFTEEGNQDFMFNDIPVFFVRDPIKFPRFVASLLFEYTGPDSNSLNRSHKRHPLTNCSDSTMFWE
jgi:catalase